MTYRIYARWPKQKVSDKTVTDSFFVAKVAYEKLLEQDWLRSKPLAVVWSQNSHTVKYTPL